MLLLADDNLNAGAQRMWNEDCGAVPVVGADGTLAGIITDRDICMAAYTKGLPRGAILVKDVMRAMFTRAIQTIPSSAPRR